MMSKNGVENMQHHNWLNLHEKEDEKKHRERDEATRLITLKAPFTD